MVIYYYSDEEFQALYERLTGRALGPDSPTCTASTDLLPVQPIDAEASRLAAVLDTRDLQSLGRPVVGSCGDRSGTSPRVSG